MGEQAKSKPRVLIVDDEKQLAQTLNDILKLRGCDPQVAFDGMQAKQKLSETEFQVVISDIRMPRMDGNSLLSYIQTNHPGTPVILISGFAEMHQDEAALAGAAAILNKPFRVRELADLVQKITGSNLSPH